MSLVKIIKTKPLFFFSISIFCIIVLYLIYHYPRPLFNRPKSTIVFDRQHNLLGARIAKDGQWRCSANDTIPHKYTKALILAEDHRFYYHLGIDPISIFGSLRDYLFSQGKLRGASTIPMQIMRMSLENKERGFSSKIIEAVYAVYLSLTQSKNKQILLYANNAPFGGNIVGIEAACWRYFGKSPSLITWAEAAMLAVLPNSPSLITIEKNRLKLKSKRDRLLKRLNAEGTISNEEYSLGLLEPLPDSFTRFPLDNQHLISHLETSNPKDSRFISTIDFDIQQICKETADYHIDELLSSNVNNIAVIVIDNSSGNVLGYIGNTNKKVSGNAVNMITSPRSTGSLLKPLLAVSLLDQGHYSIKSLVSDLPISFNDYTPMNFDKSYRGSISIMEALQRSLNIPFVSLLKEFTISRFLNTCKKAGLTSLNKTSDHYGLSLILGGGEAPLWELAGAYASMARTLLRYQSSYSKYSKSDLHFPRLIDKTNNTKLDLSFEPYLFSAGSIYTCFEALSALKRPDEEGRWEEFSSSKKIAWKTGTSFGNRDAWAIGVDKKYTVGVWLGNANGNSRSNIMGVKIAAPVLFDIFNRLPSSDWFSKPFDDLKKVVLCNDSGYKASKICPNHDTAFVSIISENISTCNFHKLVFTDTSRMYQVKADCFDPNKIASTPYFILPPSQAVYYRDAHPEYRPLPPFHPDCSNLQNADNENNITIIYPLPNIVIHPIKLKSGEREKIILKANTQDQKAKLFWHLNDQYLGSTEIFHSKALNLSKNKYSLSVMDDKGGKSKVYFEVK
jgi:penicillin-binding protein 1C